MSPPRDSFALALGALRSRLRQGIDPPGAALPISLIAEELGLSPTPVREALARLAGEDLVDKRGPAYTRPRLDAVMLAELYGHRLLHLAVAMAAEPARRAGLRRFPARPPAGLSAELGRQEGDPATVVERLWMEIVLWGQDLVVAQACQRTSERLAPFLVSEALLFADTRREAEELAAAFEQADRPALRVLTRRHHRRRIAAAGAIVAAAERNIDPI